MKTRTLILAIVGALILLLTVQTCNNNKYNQLKGEHKVLEKQYNAQKNVIKTTEEKRIKEKDSLNKEILKRELSNTNSKNKISELQRKIEQVKSNRIAPSSSYVEIAKEYNEIYSTNQAVATNNSVDLKGDLSFRVLENVYDANECQEIFKLKDEQMTEQSNIISNLEKDKAGLNFQLKSSENSINEYKSLNDIAEDNINNLKKQNSKLKTKSVFNKILIPVAFIGGGFLGYRLAK